MLAPLQFRLLQVGACRHPECVAIRGGQWGAATFPALCGLIQHPTLGNWLFDTGYSTHFLEATQPFPERFYRWITPMQLPEEQQLIFQLARLGLRPVDINGIILSHFHADHIAGLRDYPNAQIVAMYTEYTQLIPLSRTRGLFHAFLPQLLPDDFLKRARFVESMHRLTLPPELRPFHHGFDLLGDGSLLAVPLPGHSHHQLGLLLRCQDGQTIFLVADACWSIKALQQNRPPSWLAEQLFDDKHAYRTTFGQLQQLAYHNPNLLVVPSHCEITARALIHATI